MKKNQIVASRFNILKLVKKKQLLLSAIFFNIISIYGQGAITFEKTYGGEGDDFGLSAQQTEDGGYILFGQTNSFGNGEQDMYLVKADKDGNELWSKTYGGIDFEFGISVQEIAGGGYILCGAYGGLVNDALSLIKVDELGNEIWNKKYSGSMDRDVGQFVQQTGDGGFIAIGFTGAFPQENIYILKTDSDGNEEWSKVLETTTGEHAAGVRQTNDGGYVIIGDTEGSGAGGKDMYLLKIDSLGTVMWTKTFGTPLDEIGRSIQITNDGGYIILGYEDSNEGKLFMVKTDAEGNELWNNYYGGAGKDFGYSVEQTQDLGYILSGVTQSATSGTSDMYCVKTDNLGVVTWERTYPKGLRSEAYFVQQTTDNGYMAFGYTLSEEDFSTNMYLVKIDEEGSLSVTDNDFEALKTLAYPNPFTDRTTVKFGDQKNRNYSIMLYNVQGQIVKSINNITDNEVIIKRDNLPNGLYFYQVSDQDTQSITTGRLIIK